MLNISFSLFSNFLLFYTLVLGYTTIPQSYMDFDNTLVLVGIGGFGLELAN